MKEAFLDGVMFYTWIQFMIVVGFMMFFEVPLQATMLAVACAGLGFVLLLRRVRKTIYS
jgi:hypothetical protein